MKWCIDVMEQHLIATIGNYGVIWQIVWVWTNTFILFLFFPAFNFVWLSSFYFFSVNCLTVLIEKCNSLMAVCMMRIFRCIQGILFKTKCVFKMFFNARIYHNKNRMYFCLDCFDQIKISQPIKILSRLLYLSWLQDVSLHCHLVFVWIFANQKLWPYNILGKYSVSIVVIEH